VVLLHACCSFLVLALPWLSVHVCMCLLGLGCWSNICVSVARNPVLSVVLCCVVLCCVVLSLIGGDRRRRGCGKNIHRVTFYSKGCVCACVRALVATRPWPHSTATRCFQQRTTGVQPRSCSVVSVVSHSMLCVMFGGFRFRFQPHGADQHRWYVEAVP